MSKMDTFCFLDIYDLWLAESLCVEPVEPVDVENIYISYIEMYYI